MLGWSADAVPNLAVVETVDSVKVSFAAAFVACSSFDTLIVTVSVLLAASILSVCYCTRLVHCAAFDAQFPTHLAVPANEILSGLKCRLHGCSWQTNSTQL